MQKCLKSCGEAFISLVKVKVVPSSAVKKERLSSESNFCFDLCSYCNRPVDFSHSISLISHNVSELRLKTKGLYGETSFWNSFLNSLIRSFCLLLHICWIQTLSLDSVSGQDPPAELLLWVTSCPEGEQKGGLFFLFPERWGGLRSEIRDLFSSFKD